MTLESDLPRIEAALAAGPTTGPWHHHTKTPYFVVKGNAPHSYIVAVAPPANSGRSQSEIDAAYIAACGPDAIRRLVKIANLTDQVIGALRLAVVIVPPGTDRSIIVAAIDALVAAKEPQL